MPSPISELGFAYYDAHADEFKSAVNGRPPVPDAVWLAAELPPGSLVVDAGCGTGEDAAYLAGQGLRVYAYDASAEMVRLTREHLAQTTMSCGCVVRQHRHDQLQLQECAAGVLASASLLFLDDADLKIALGVLASSLAPGGLLLASFKQGTDARKQPDGRVYYDRMPGDLKAMAGISGLLPEGVVEKRDNLGRGNSWVTFLLRKPT